MGSAGSKTNPLSLAHFIGLPVKTVLRAMASRNIHVSVVAMKDGDIYNHSSKSKTAVLLYNPITNIVTDLLV